MGKTCQRDFNKKRKFSKLNASYDTNVNSSSQTRKITKSSLKKKCTEIVIGNECNSNDKITNLTEIKENVTRKVKDEIVQFNSEEFSTEKSEKLFINSNNSSVENIGFKTAGGKQIKVSKQSLAKAEKLITEVNCTVNELTKDIYEENVTEANLKSLRCEFQKSKGKFDELINIKSIDDMNGNISVGFKTASGKTINIPESALTKAKLFCCEDDESNSDFLKCNKTQSQALGEKKFNRILPDSNRESIDELKNPRIGFKTAAGNSIITSEAALTKAKLRFKHWNEVNSSKIVREKLLDNPNSTITSKVFVTGKEKLFKSPILEKESSSNLSRERKTLGCRIDKQIIISEDKLKLARDLFSDILCENDFKTEGVAAPRVNECLKNENIFTNTKIIRSNIVVQEVNDDKLREYEETLNKQFFELKRKMQILEERRKIVESQYDLIKTDVNSHRQ